ncbi:MAG: cupin domain-containing protein [Candidatus Promineifilaceae bacterium]
MLSGMLSVRLNGREQTYVAGERFTIPRGTVHEMRNLGSVPVETNWVVTPALNTEQFMETVWGLSDEGKLMNPLQYAVLARAYDDVFRLAKPARWLQSMLFVPLSVIGRLLGYRAVYT